MCCEIMRSDPCGPPYILVTSTYRRIVFKMFIVSLDDSDHVTVITLAVLVPFRFSYVARA